MKQLGWPIRRKATDKARLLAFQSGSVSIFEICRFYFADERTSDAAPIFRDLGGQAYAEAYYGLATLKDTKPWEYTFVKGEGYVNFGTRVGAIPHIDENS